jgi:adenylate cyclase
MTLLHPRQYWIVAGVALVGAAIGVGYVLVRFQFAWDTIARGVIIGALISGTMVFAELAERVNPFLAALRRLPFALFLLVRMALRLLVIVGIMLAIRLLIPLDDAPFAEGLVFDAIFALGVSILISLVFEIDRLLGPGTLWRLLTGGYHTPRIEHRAFLFLDLEGSTAIAARIGPERFLALLDHLTRIVSPAFLAHRGEIYRYVGDAIIVSWPVEAAVRDARILRCLGDAVGRLLAAREDCQARFGVAPFGRAALHAGPVAVGEVGEVKREITFLGDTLNAVAKMEKFAGERQLRTVLSEDLLARLDLPPGFAVTPVGALELPGRERPLGLYALDFRPVVPAARRRGRFTRSG